MKKKQGQPRRSRCTTVRLAESSVAAVDACGCGTMQLHLGALTVRLAPSAVSELLSTLGTAVAAHAARQAKGNQPEGFVPRVFDKRGDA